MKLSELILKNRNLTPQQYYFPYFLEPRSYEAILAGFGIKPMVLLDRENKIESELHFIKNEQHRILEYGSHFMISDNELVTWKTSTDQLEIQKMPLFNEFAPEKLTTFKIELAELKTGLNRTGIHTGLKFFVTYVRKSDLKYEQDSYDNFVVVVIKDNMIRLIPFDWFNSSGADHGYVWPAIAQVDIKKQKLYGNGMRMNYFQTDLELEPDYS